MFLKIFDRGLLGHMLPIVKMRFSDGVLLGLKPRRAKYDVHDSEGTGLLLRVSPHGRKTWMVGYRSATGIKHQRPIGKYPAIRIPKAREAALAALNGHQANSEESKYR